MLNTLIDINCDMGESIGDRIIGQDEKLMPFVTSCNIACGFHGGDPFHMEKTIELALAHNVRIGAHPSYPDLEGFGRRKMKIPKDELIAIIQYQVSALKGMVESQGARLSYVKPHGALYNMASKDRGETNVIIEAIQSIDANLGLMGLAGSEMEDAAYAEGVTFIREAFCDRRYESDGTLMLRKNSGAVISKVHEAVEQLKSIVNDQKITLLSGGSIEISADSICIHGDNPLAYEILLAISTLLKKN